MKKQLIIIMVCLAYAGLQAQSADQLIEMAKTYNPTLRALQLDHQAALQRADQVDDYPDPQVNIGIGVLPVETRLGAQRFKIGVSQMIPWKGLLDRKSALATAQAEVLSSMDLLQEINIAFAIRIAYARLLFLGQQQGIIDDKLLVLAQLEALAKSGLRSGKGKLSNVLLIQRSKINLEMDKSLIEKQKEQPTIAINRWTGRAFDTPIDLVVDALERSEISDHLGFATSQHPQLSIYEQQKRASQQAVALTKYAQKPQIGVGLEYALIDARNDVDIRRNGRDVLMPMGSIKIPLNTSRYRAKRQEERIKQEAIDARTQEAIDRYSAEIRTATTTIEWTEQSIVKSNDLKIITSETLQLMRTEYATEGTRFEELLRLEMDLIDYDLDIFRSELRRKLAEAVLGKYE